MSTALTREEPHPLKNRRLAGLAIPEDEAA